VELYGCTGIGQHYNVDWFLARPQTVHEELECTTGRLAYVVYFQYIDIQVYEFNGVLLCVCIGMKRRDSAATLDNILNLTCSEPAFEDCCLVLWNRVREGASYISHTLSPCTLQLFSNCTCRSHSPFPSQLAFPASGFRTLPSSTCLPLSLPQPSPSLLPPHPPTLRHPSHHSPGSQSAPAHCRITRSESHCSDVDEIDDRQQDMLIILKNYY